MAAVCCTGAFVGSGSVRSWRRIPTPRSRRRRPARSPSPSAVMS